jgi:hypothetical protein
LLRELVAEIGKHPAGDLENQDVRVHALVGGAGEFRELLIDLLEVEAEFLEFPGIIVRAAGVAL